MEKLKSKSIRSARSIELNYLYCSALDKLRDQGINIPPSQIVSEKIFFSMSQSMQEEIIRSIDPTFSESNPFSGCPKKGSF